MKIAVLGGYTVNPGDISWGALPDLGDFVAFPQADHEAYSAATDAEILLVDNVGVDDAFLSHFDRARFVGLFATGVDQVDLTAARTKGVAVTNVPGYAAASVAQLAISLLLSLAHRVVEYDRFVREGGWRKGHAFRYLPDPTVELRGKTLGVIGFGAIGTRVAQIAAAIGMEIVGIETRKSEVPGVTVGWLDWDQFLRRCDTISLHLPLTPQTQRIIDASAIAAMKRDVLIVNTSRGGIVDDTALATALHEGRIGGYGCDVIGPTEPPAEGHPLLSAPRCVITPHIGWATPEARQRCIDEVARNVQSFLKGGRRNRID